VRWLARSYRDARWFSHVLWCCKAGGALGSYQAGVYETLASSEYLPDWVAGTSIGAINAAIIAGNAATGRVARLRTFWDEVTSPTAWWPAGLDATSTEVQRKTSAAVALLCGQPGFFTPHRPFEPQGAYKDYEFGRVTMNQRWQQGATDALATLQVSPWTTPARAEIGVRTFDVIHDIMVRLVGDEANARSATRNGTDRKLADLMRSYLLQGLEAARAPV